MIAGQKGQAVVKLSTPNQIVAGLLTLLQRLILFQGVLGVIFLQLRQLGTDEFGVRCFGGTGFFQKIQNIVDFGKQLIANENLHFQDIKAQIMTLYSQRTVGGVKSLPIPVQEVQTHRHQVFCHPSGRANAQHLLENLYCMAVIAAGHQDFAHGRQDFRVFRSLIQRLFQFFFSFYLAAQLQQTVGLDLQHFGQSCQPLFGFGGAVIFHIPQDGFHRLHMGQGIFKIFNAVVELTHQIVVGILIFVIGIDLDCQLHGVVQSLVLGVAPSQFHGISGIRGCFGIAGFPLLDEFFVPDLHQLRDLILQHGVIAAGTHDLVTLFLGGVVFTLGGQTLGTGDFGTHMIRRQFQNVGCDCLGSISDSIRQANICPKEG